jgi:hypothetical protein
VSNPDFTKPAPDFLKQDIERLTNNVKSARVIAQAIVEGQQAKAELQRMVSLAAVADRIKSKREAHIAKADEWAKRLDAIDKQEPQAFAIGEAAIAEREADMKSLENDLKALSNLPLSDSSTSSSA